MPLEGKERHITLRPRACDFCRKKKIRCDGPDVDGACTNCEANKEECTYVQPTGRKKEPTQRYVRELETRLKYMEALLDKYSRSGAPRVEENVAPTSPQKLNPFTNDCLAPIFSDDPFLLSQRSTPVLDDSDDDGGVVRPHPHLPTLRMVASAPESTHRWYGKSSGLHLLYTAHEIKQEFNNAEDYPLEEVRLPPLSSTPLTYWDRQLHGLVNTIPAGIEFPPKDLMLHLFDLFFRYITPFYPILHRSTFEIQFADGLHEHNRSHSDLVLMVCAVASIYSDDPRVYHKVNKLRIPGYRYFSYVNQCAHLSATQLPDLQACVLRAIYFDYIGQRHVGWFILGAGIRCAQDVGAHRKAFQGSTKPAEKEMWRRTFWCLVTLDRLVSCAIGQIPAVNDEDLDVAFPSSLPSEDPAESQYFSALVHLGTLASMVLRTLYTIRPWSGTIFGGLPKEKIMAQLDSTMSKWISIVPSHLRWDPHRENLIHFEQSAELHSMFYLLVMMAHRPNIARRRSSEHERNLDLDICTGAARSCTRVISNFSRRSVLISCHAYTAAFASAALLMTAVWTGKQLDPHANVAELEVDMLECVCALRRAEKRWMSAGRMVDTLHNLATSGGIGFPDLSVPLSDNVAVNVQLDSPLGMGDDRSLQEKILDQMLSGFSQADSVGDGSLSSIPTLTSPHSHDNVDIRLSHTLFENSHRRVDDGTNNQFWRTWSSAADWQNWASGLAQDRHADPQ